MVVVDRISVLDETLSRLNGKERGISHSRLRPVEYTWLRTIVLPKATAARRGFWEVQEKRRSVHGFQRCAVSLADVAAVCEAAYDPHANTEILLVAQNVEDLTPGLYAYDEGRLGLLEEVPADSKRREEWFLQREFASAPAVLIFVSSVSACGESMHAYRQMMVGVGKQCQDAALAAVGIELGGVIFAGLLMAGLLDIGIDGFHRTGIVGYAFGCPLE